MKLLTSGKPEKAADRTRGARLALQNPYLRVSEQALYAATPHIAVRLPVEIEDGDTDGPITADALTAARKQRAESIGANGKLDVVGGKQDVTLSRPDGVTFPNVEQVIPTDDKIGDFSVAINPKQLMDLAEAMGAATVRLAFSKDQPTLSAIRVTPVAFDGLRPDAKACERIVGVMMPVRAP